MSTWPCNERLQGSVKTPAKHALLLLVQVKPETQNSGQDTWLADEFVGGSATALFGVFDGHGLDGRKVSNAVASRLPKLLGECADFKARRAPWSQT